jgi:hypothetical protein
MCWAFVLFMLPTLVWSLVSFGIGWLVLCQLQTRLLEVTSIWWNGKEIVVVVQGSDLWFRDVGLGML